MLLLLLLLLRLGRVLLLGLLLVLRMLLLLLLRVLRLRLSARGTMRRISGVRDMPQGQNGPRGRIRGIRRHRSVIG